MLIERIEIAAVDSACSCGFSVPGYVNWDGWNTYAEHDRGGETYMAGKTWVFISWQQRDREKKRRRYRTPFLCYFCVRETANRRHQIAISGF